MRPSTLSFHSGHIDLSELRYASEANRGFKPRRLQKHLMCFSSLHKKECFWPATISSRAAVRSRIRPSSIEVAILQFKIGFVWQPTLDHASLKHTDIPRQIWRQTKLRRFTIEMLTRSDQELTLLAIQSDSRALHSLMEEWPCCPVAVAAS